MRSWMHYGAVDVAEASDQRRRQGRDVTEVIRDLAVALEPDERALLDAVYGRGQSAAEVARLLRDTPRRVRGRIGKLVRRVLAPEFALVVARKDSWTNARRRVAVACFVRGWSLRKAVAELGLSLHTVRHHRLAVTAMLDAARVAEIAA